MYRFSVETKNILALHSGFSQLFFFESENRQPTYREVLEAFARLPGSDGPLINAFKRLIKGLDLDLPVKDSTYLRIRLQPVRITIAQARHR